jgi:predicted TIM-barrel fold metal-dependent hydrolase
MLDEIKPHRDRFYGVASWNFDYTNYNSTHGKYGAWALGRRQYDLMAELYKAGHIVAVKFYTGYYHYMPNDPKIAIALETLNKVGCPAIFHCGDCLNSVKCAKLKYAHPLNIDDVAVDYPNMNFIIAHMGYPFQREAAEVCYKNSNVYSDISGFVYGSFSDNDKVKFQKVLSEFIDIAGSDKLLFGTDFPISDQSSYVDVLDTEHGHWLTAQALTTNVMKAFNLK